MTQISDALRRARSHAGLSQAALAKQLGISAQYLCDIELGRRTLPKAYFRRLPTEIRPSVIASAIATLRRQIAELEAIEGA